MKKNLIKKYSDNPYVRALVTAVPYIGGAIDVIISEKGSEWRKERIELLLKNLNEKIGKLEIDQDEILRRFESEEFYDSIIHVLESSTKTRHHSKIKGYSNILANQLIDRNTKKQFSIDLILSTMDTITIDEIEYLSKLYHDNGEIEIYKIYNKFIYLDVYKQNIEKFGNEARNQSELPKECIFNLDLDIIWKFLSDKNIITFELEEKENDVEYFYQTSNQSTSGHIRYSAKKVYKLTDYGNYFINWVIDNE